MEQTKASSLIDMANGAIKERLDYEMGRVIQNISDLNTKATAKRTITVKTALAVGQEGGHTVAVELTPQIPGQFDAYGGEAPERKVLKFADIHTA